MGYLKEQTRKRGEARGEKTGVRERIVASPHFIATLHASEKEGKWRNGMQEEALGLRCGSEKVVSRPVRQLEAGPDLEVTQEIFECHRRSAGIDLVKRVLYHQTPRPAGAGGERRSAPRNTAPEWRGSSSSDVNLPLARHLCQLENCNPS